MDTFCDFFNKQTRIRHVITNTLSLKLVLDQHIDNEHSLTSDSTITNYLFMWTRKHRNFA